MDVFIRNIRIAWRAETLIAEAKLRTTIKKSTAAAFAGLIAIFGLGMLNVAGFLAISPHWGDVNAALAVSAVDFLIAVALISWAGKLKTGPELDLAREVRDSAIHEIGMQAEQVENELRGIKKDILGLKDSIGTFARNPLDAGASALLAPLIAGIVKSFASRSKKNR